MLAKPGVIDGSAELGTGAGDEVPPTPTPPAEPTDPVETPLPSDVEPPADPLVEAGPEGVGDAVSGMVNEIWLEPVADGVGSARGAAVADNAPQVIAIVARVTSAAATAMRILTVRTPALQWMPSPSTTAQAG